MYPYISKLKREEAGIEGALGETQENLKEKQHRQIWSYVTICDSVLARCYRLKFKSGCVASRKTKLNYSSSQSVP